MQQAIYTKSFTLDFTHCYANGLLKYSALSNMLQLTAADHAEELGFGYLEMAKAHQSWVLSRIRFEIEKLPRFLSKIEVQTWIHDFQGNRSTREFEVSVNGKKMIGVTSFWAVFNTKERKSEQLNKEIDPDIVLKEKTATRLPYKRIDATTHYDHSFAYETKLSDLDIVNHVNNVKYTDWCLDTLDSEMVLEKPFHAINVNYIKELRLGQAVQIRQHISDSIINFAITKEDRTVFLMEIER